MKIYWNRESAYVRARPLLVCTSQYSRLETNRLVSTIRTHDMHKNLHIYSLYMYSPVFNTRSHIRSWSLRTPALTGSENTRTTTSKTTASTSRSGNSRRPSTTSRKNWRKREYIVTVWGPATYNAGWVVVGRFPAVLPVNYSPSLGLGGHWWHRGTLAGNVRTVVDVPL